MLTKLTMKGGFSNGMDPQKLSQLDPKLREAYQRVMGTSIPNPPQAPPVQRQAPVPQPQPTPKSVETPSMPTPPSQHIEAIPTQPQPIPVQAPSNFANFTPPPSTPQAQTITMKKKSGIVMPIIFTIVGLIFIVIYTFFWTKIFNLKLPFLP
jgi:hypothetical protein